MVESANKLVVEARLKGAGMHWGRQHVNPMLVLGNAVCNQRWPETWQASPAPPDGCLRQDASPLGPAQRTAAGSSPHSQPSFHPLFLAAALSPSSSETGGSSCKKLARTLVFSAPVTPLEEKEIPAC